MRATPLPFRGGAGGGALNLSEMMTVPPLHTLAGGGEGLGGEAEITLNLTLNPNYELRTPKKRCNLFCLLHTAYSILHTY